MYLLYLDDSGSVDNPQEVNFVLGGFAVHEDEVSLISASLDQLATSIPGPDVEFHASAIFSRRESPWKGRSKEQAQQVIKDVLSVLASTNHRATAFAVAVNKRDCRRQNTDPMSIAFTSIVQAFATFLDRRDVDGKGLIILDESTHATKLEELARDFRNRIATEFSFPANRIVEGPLFVSSRKFRCIQLADHIAYSVYRRYEAKDANYFDVFAHRFEQVNGLVTGLRHYDVENEMNCLCPACISQRVLARMFPNRNAMKTNS